jgi:hypothetical protein
MDLTMETKTINYTINFLSEWHAGSGLSAGAGSDAVVIRDKNNLPYLPGKTIKGLLLDVFRDFEEVQSDEVISKILLQFENKSGDNQFFFSNAEMLDNEKNEISKEMSHHLYRNIASTTIDENGIAKSGSLRTIEVSVPLTLMGKIDGVIPEFESYFEKALKYLRHIGTNRNRGLGRCQIVKIKS